MSKDKVLFTKISGANITNLTHNTAYYVIWVDANTIKLALDWENSIAGTARDITSGTGEYTLSRYVALYNTASHTAHADSRAYPDDSYSSGD